MTLRYLYFEYKFEFIFGAVLLALVVISYALSPLIDAEIFRQFISPVQNVAILTVTVINTWALWRHSEGLRIRRYFSGMMASLTLLTIIAIFQRLSMGNSLDAAEGIFSFEGWEMLFGDIIAWLFLAYPSELLRSGWLSWKNAITRLLFRSKPWLEKVESTEPSEEVEEPVSERTEVVPEAEEANDANAGYRRALEEWMEKAISR